MQAQESSLWAKAASYGNKRESPVYISKLGAFSLVASVCWVSDRRLLRLLGLS